MDSSGSDEDNEEEYRVQTISRQKRKASDGLETSINRKGLVAKKKKVVKIQQPTTADLIN